MFLLQDSSNIFELAPAERIDILKNVFDLLSIDTAKDRIVDKRREVQLQKKILADTQTQDEKLRTTLQQIIEQYRQLSHYPQRQLLHNHTTTINEREMLVDKITLQDCSIPTQAKAILDDIHSIIKQQQEKYHNYVHKLHALQFSIEKQQQKAQQINQEIVQYTNEKQQLTQQIEQAQVPDPATIKMQISTLQSQQDSYIQSIDLARYQSIINTLGLDPIVQNNPLQFAYQAIQACIQQGKLLTQEKATIEQQQQTLEQRKQEYQKQLDDLQTIPGTTSYIQLQQTIAREQEIKHKELAAIQREEELLAQQLADHQTRIRHISDRMAQLTTNNPDIADCVKEIQDAINTQDARIIENITRIISKYLGDKQLTGLTHELEQAQKQLHTLDYDAKQAKYTEQKQIIENILHQLQNNPEQVL
jgi:chromosome segregation ATPase